MKTILITFVFILVCSANIFAKKTTFQTLNIMDDFWKSWEQGEKADIPTQTQLFWEMVINPHKEIYEGFTGKLDDAELAGYIKGVTPLIPKIRKITEQLKKELPEAITNFKKDFSRYELARDCGFNWINETPYNR